MRFSLASWSLPLGVFAPIGTPIRFGVARFVIGKETARPEVACSEIGP